jgi:hypothetical protein
MTTTRWMLASVVVLVPSILEADVAKTKAPPAKMDMSKAEMMNAKDIKWGDAPADLPKGAKLGVLHGDPTKPGVFTVRLKLPDGYKIPPHWHSKDEQLTVLSGTFVLYTGDTMTLDPHDLDEGAYHFLPGKQHHAAEAKGETIVQVNGTGPFDIHYLKESDNPNPKSASK